MCWCVLHMYLPSLNSPNMTLPVLRIFGNIAVGNNDHTQVILSALGETCQRGQTHSILHYNSYLTSFSSLPSIRNLS